MGKSKLRVNGMECAAVGGWIDMKLIGNLKES